MVLNIAFVLRAALAEAPGVPDSASLGAMHRLFDERVNPLDETSPACREMPPLAYITAVLARMQIVGDVEDAVMMVALMHLDLCLSHRVFTPSIHTLLLFTFTGGASHKHLNHYVFLIDQHVNDYEEDNAHYGSPSVGKLTAHLQARELPMMADEDRKVATGAGESAMDIKPKLEMLRAQGSCKA